MLNLANALADTASARNDTNLFAESVRTYRQSLQLDPQSTDAHINLGMVWEAQKREDLAIVEYGEAARIAPDSEQVQLKLADALSRAEKLAEAAQHYEAAEKLNPGRVENYSRAGLCYAMLGQMEPAARQFGEVIRLNPADASAYGNLGNALSSLNRFG